MTLWNRLYIHFRPVSFCPIGFFPQQGCGDLYVPAGTYRLAEADLAPFAAHASLVIGVSEAAMEMACSRLADAENRTRPQDRAVDAVIGMEAILLAGLGTSAEGNSATDSPCGTPRCSARRRNGSDSIVSRGTCIHSAARLPTGTRPAANTGSATRS